MRAFKYIAPLVFAAAVAAALFLRPYEEETQTFPGAVPGQLRWKTRVASRGASKPVVSGGEVFCRGTTVWGRSVVAYDAETGKRLWARSSRFTSPCVVEAVGVCNVKGNSQRVEVLDPKTGKMKWSFVAETVSLWSIFGISDTSILFWTDSGVSALDLKTGDVRWTIGKIPISPGSWPVVSNGLAFLSGSGTVHCVDAVTGTELWDAGGGKVARDTCAGEGLVCFVRDYATLVAVDAQNGKEKWTFGGSPMREIFSPLIAAGKVYFSGDGSVSCLDARDGAQQWVFPPPKGGSIVSPVVSGRTVYACSKNVLYALDAATGAEKWQYAFDDNIIWQPDVSAGFVYCVSRKGYLYAIVSEPKEQNK